MTWRKRTLRVGLAAFFLLLGPLHFRAELVGPGGNVHWHSILSGVLGTCLWVLGGMWVLGQF